MQTGIFLPKFKAANYSPLPEYKIKIRTVTPEFHDRTSTYLPNEFIRRTAINKGCKDIME
jgi:hypothetical protein